MIQRFQMVNWGKKGNAVMMEFIWLSASERSKIQIQLRVFLWYLSVASLSNYEILWQSRQGVISPGKSGPLAWRWPFFTVMAFLCCWNNSPFPVHRVFPFSLLLHKGVPSLPNSPGIYNLLDWIYDFTKTWRVTDFKHLVYHPISLRFNKLQRPGYLLATKKKGRSLERKT